MSQSSFERPPGPEEMGGEIASSRDEKPQGEPRIRVLFENDDLLAADKPEGVISIAEAGKGGLPELLKEAFQGRLYPVHRLDKEVSGVIVFAKNDRAHRHMNSEFESRSVKKTYL